MSDWYEQNIEEGVRDIVKLLRENGFNTICSCHHDMTIQSEFIPDGRLQELHHLLFCYLTEKGEPVSYEIVARYEFLDGREFDSVIEVRLKGRDKVAQ